MTQTSVEFLEHAADISSPCTLSIPASPIAIVRRSTVLASDDRGVWVAFRREDAELMKQAIAAATPIHVSLRSLNSDILFRAMPLELAMGLVPDTKIAGPALLIDKPHTIQTSQQRQWFRVPLVESDGVQVRLWKINEYVVVRDRPMASSELRCDPKDLSEGGLGAIVYARGEEAMNLKSNQRFRVEIRSGKHEMVFEARLRHPAFTERDDSHAHCGLELIHNDRDLDCRRNRQKLQLVLGELQRNAVRRNVV